MAPTAPTPPRLSLSSLLGGDPAGGVTALLEGRRWAGVHATRVAIRAACDLLGLRPGDEVLVPAYHCGSEIAPLLQAGLRLRPYAVGADTVAQAEVIAARITPGVRAVYLTHYFGFPQPETAEIRALCDRHDLALMEDCALGLLSEGPARIGTLGDVAFHCFSKVFPVGFGGALVVNNPALALPDFPRAAPVGPVLRHLARSAVSGLIGACGMAALRAWRRGGASETSAAGEARPEMPQDYYFDPALSGARLSPLVRRALGGLAVAEARAERRRNFGSYQRLLQGVPGIVPLFASLPEGVCPLNFPVLVQDRDRLARELSALGLPVTPWWAGYHRDFDLAEFPEARQLKDDVLALPLHQGVTEAQIAALVGALVARV